MNGGSSSSRFSRLNLSKQPQRQSITEKRDNDNNSSNSGSSRREIMWRIIWYLSAGVLSFVFLRSTVYNWIRNVLFKRSSTTGSSNGSNGFIDDLFQSPFLDDNEELRLRPVSVNTYVYVLPTHQNEDGIFVKLLIENTSELSTE